MHQWAGDKAKLDAQRGQRSIRSFSNDDPELYQKTGDQGKSRSDALQRHHTSRPERFNQDGDDPVQVIGLKWT